MEYLLERGVDPEFAVKTLRAENTDMWFPIGLIPTFGTHDFLLR